MAEVPYMSQPGNEARAAITFANAVLGDNIIDSNNKSLRYPIDRVLNIVANTILTASREDREALLSTLDPTGPMVKVRLPSVLGIGKGLVSISTRNLSGYLENEFSYSDGNTIYRVEDFERHREIIEEIWGCRVTIKRMSDNPLGVTIRPAPPPIRLPLSIPLVPAGANGVVLGTDVFTGEVIVTHVRDLPHMLIAGTSGFGKSVFLNQLIAQLLEADSAEVDELVLVDLKGGVEFAPFASRGDWVRVVWEFWDVVEVVERLIELMVDRQREMVANGWRLYPGRRVFFIVDEFAQIQLYPVEGKEEKATHARLIANLNRLSMLGRAVGIVLIAAIQKPTTDVMDSSFRMNLQGQVCFKVPNRLLASTMFGSVDELSLDPMTLPRGRFIYYDPLAGVTRYLQSHVAPE